MKEKRLQEQGGHNNRKQEAKLSDSIQLWLKRRNTGPIGRKHKLCQRGVFSEDPGSAKAFNAEEMEEANAFELQRAKAKGLCRSGDFVAALHQVKDASMIKILIVK
ncbi:hypothetical protein MRB53_034919 [Persea americana]|uniref:Uncharacterized protein n=1 Tax=Persea americana TaxID=3435 RepID=A0ACC2K3E8_PERAE|nr:hypothetical protein MRB53_034919 [Persea americana]